MTTRCRIAPSPTGPLHIGTARTALFNYLFARQTGGTFVLRLEDTDQARSTLEFEQDILEGLHWLGIDWDEGPRVAGLPARGAAYGPYRQSQRGDLYAEALEKLLAEDKAYPCFCTTEEREADRAANPDISGYIGRCANLTEAEREARRAEGRDSVIRFRIGEGAVEFDDLVRGHVSIDTAQLGGDLVIARSDGSPLYHFVVVVDDIAMRISHVIRGEDHLSNTPKHVLLFKALGAEPPAFAHLPLILNPDRSKMSKRKSQTAVDTYREQGYIKEAIVNHLALLGWSSGDDEDLFSLGELEQRFDLSRVQPGGAIFDTERLDWLDGQWIRRLPEDELVDLALPFLAASVEAAADEDHKVRTPTTDDLETLLPMVVERLPRLDAIGPMLDFVFIEDIEVDPAILVPKRWDPATTVTGLAEARRVVEELGEISFEADELEPPLRALCEQQGWKVGDLFMAIRVAITGPKATPPLFDVMVAIGHDATLARLVAAGELLANAPAED
ncbi:MAG: glutamate--tRNA ligase [Chloroflexota bacterium]|nr:glutamate--tRNA ligase [Chloroflexota bacterium]